MTELVITRLLQNPLGQLAPPDHRGDIVRVSDGRAKVYIDPDEFDQATEEDLRALLLGAREEARAAARDARSRANEAALASTAAERAHGTAAKRVHAEGSTTSLRRAGRPAERLW